MPPFVIDFLKQIVKALKALFPKGPIISMNIRDFEKATCFNKDMI